MRKVYILGIILAACSFSIQAIELNFDKVLECHASVDKPGMAIQIEQAGKLVYKGAIGVADVETKRKLRTNDTFQIGSITKMFTAAAILKLSEQGKLSLQGTLGEYIPHINSQYKTLTIEQVLTHTSGLPDYLDDPAVTAIWNSYFTLDDIIKIISKRPLRSKPGEKYSYSNLGYVLLGKVIEVSSTVTYQEFLHQAFFKPLRMDDTYVVTKGNTVGEVKGYTSSRREPIKLQRAEHSIDREWNVDRSWISAAGAVASTLEDMSRWQAALKSGRVISKSNYHKMHSNAVLLNQVKVNYGYGIDIYPISGLASYSHQGMVPGFFAWHVYFPEADLTATAFTNIDTKHPGPALLDMVAIQLDLSPKIVENQTAVGLANALVGRYQATDSNILTITFESGTLYSQYTGEKKRKILPREGNAYSYESTENYFQLRESNGVKQIVPVYLYQGEQAPMKKLEY